MAKTRNELPSAAFKVNGNFIEDTVSGYHTLNADGKWTLPQELNVVDTSVRSGSILTNTRYPAREIEIEYLITGTSWDDLQASYTSLMSVLNTQNAEIIFNGEPDKFLKGYFVIGDDIDTTYTTRHGTFTIVCLDPFKYSTAVYESTAVGGQFNITYNGTYNGYPKLITTFPESLNADGDDTSTSECGFVGFVNQRGAILQFGDPNETDWADVTYPATVPVNKTFKSLSGWTTNGSSVLLGTQVGTAAVSSNHAYASAYSTGTGWHGPSISKIITGESSPIGTNFNFYWKQKFVATAAQYGGFEAILWNNNSGTRTLVSAVKLQKTQKNTRTYVNLYVGSTSTAKGIYEVECSKIGECSMKKVGDKVTFSVGGYTKSYADPAIESLVANEITFHFTQKKSAVAMGTNYLSSCKLQRTQFDNYEDIANIFAPGDVLTVETATAGVYLDDGSATITAAYLGALGNDWEDFYLTKGANLIGVDYSDFTTAAPTFKIQYRERFL